MSRVVINLSQTVRYSTVCTGGEATRRHPARLIVNGVVLADRVRAADGLPGVAIETCLGAS